MRQIIVQKLQQRGDAQQQQQQLLQQQRGELVNQSMLACLHPAAEYEFLVPVVTA
jgi:hypothetical protein